MEENLDHKDIKLFRHEFSTMIKEMKSIVNQFQCPKNSTYFGGSCYLLSRLTSTANEANQTCDKLDFNLMQIRNTIQLFYAVHILITNNLSALIIDIDPRLINNLDQSEYSNERFRKKEIKYNKARQEILNELNSTGLRILKRSVTISQSIEYEDFNSDEIINNFESIDNILQKKCDRIDWYITNNDSTIFKLTSFSVSNKRICSLDRVESDIKYKHICEYVLDYCFANDICGQHGRCINTLSGFKCSCSFLYDGIHCEKISQQGKQIMIAVLLILILYTLSLRFIRCIIACTLRKFIQYCSYGIHRKKRQNVVDYDSHNLGSRVTTDNNRNEVPYRLAKKFHLPKNPIKRDLQRLFWVIGLSIFILVLLLSITYFISFKYENINDMTMNDTIISIVKCKILVDYRRENTVFFPIASALLFVFLWLIKREKQSSSECNARPNLTAPIKLFSTENRLITAAVFCLIVYQISKMFEELLFSTIDRLNHGVLVELSILVGLVASIGFRYYPILASLQSPNLIARFLICPYFIANIIYVIIRESSCMRSLPLSGDYSVLQEAKLRIEFGTWLIIYSLMKTIPHFILLSYITAELCVRFAYDSIYIPHKKKPSIIDQKDEFLHAKNYVIKLFRRSGINFSTDVNIDEFADFEHEVILQKTNQSCIKKVFNSIYPWDTDFRFTTLSICLYTSSLFLMYYVACTLVFIYVTKIPDYVSFINYYIETKFNVEFQGFFSYNVIILISAIVAFIIVIYHLYMGIINYKKHKLQLYKGICIDIPSPANFTSNTIVSNSIRYFGLFIGHITWGFIVLFHMILIIFITIQIIGLKIYHFESTVSVILPLLIMYVLAMSYISNFDHYYFIRTRENNLNLRNQKLYAIFLYFIFIIDCILGRVSCITRLIKGFFLDIICMPRLDTCLYGKSVEKFDFGYATYISYLYMEVTHTNPIMLAFCYSLYEDIVQRRRKYNKNNETTDLNSSDSEEDDQSMKPNAHTSITRMINLSRIQDLDQIRRQKRARFRWFLAFTLLHNYCLFDQRKLVQIRLARLHIERNNLIDNQQFD